MLRSGAGQDRPPALQDAGWPRLTPRMMLCVGLPWAQSCRGTVRLQVTLFHSTNTEHRISVISRNTKMCWMLIRLYLILQDKNPLPGSYLAHQLSARSKPTGLSFKTSKIQGYHTDTRDSHKCRSMVSTIRARRDKTVPGKMVTEKNNMQSCFLNAC